METLSSGEIVLIVVVVVAFIALGFTMSKLVELAKALRDMIPAEAARTLYAGGNQVISEVDKKVLESPNKIDDAGWELVKPRVKELIDILISEREQTNRASG